MEEIEAIKSLPFSGKKNEFALWKFKFLACCTFHKCQSILIDDNVTAPEASKTLGANDTVELDHRNQNDKAYMLLTLSITDPITFEAIQNALTTDLPGEDAKQAWKNICNIYQPSTNTEKHALEQQFYQCILSDENMNPDKWFVKLENLRIQLKTDHGCILEDAKMITQILYSPSPKIYATTISILKRELNKKSNNLDLSDIKNEFRQVFSSNKTYAKRETALVTKTFK
jgi:hypothetical protein